jgi:hypothetical protein
MCVVAAGSLQCLEQAGANCRNCDPLSLAPALKHTLGSQPLCYPTAPLFKSNQQRSTQCRPVPTASSSASTLTISGPSPDAYARLAATLLAMRSIGSVTMGQPPPQNITHIPQHVCTAQRRIQSTSANPLQPSQQESTQCQPASNPEKSEHALFTHHFRSQP